MRKMSKLKQVDVFNKVWYLVGMCFLFTLAIILLGLWENYEIGAFLQSGRDKAGIMANSSGQSLLSNYNYVTLLALALFLIVILISIPVIRKSLRVRDILFTKLDMAESEREEKIRQLEELNEFIRDLYNQAPVGFLSFNREGVITEVNQTELDWLGYTREEVIGVKKFETLFSSSFTEGTQNGLEALKKLGKFDNFETNLITKSGEQIPVLVNAKAVYDAEGQFLHSRTVIFNFTERKKMEELIRQKQLEADRLGLLKSQFIANVSHEIRTPLNAIIGFTQLLRHTYLSEKQEEFVDNILVSSENLLAIVSEILDFSRLEAGVFRLEPIPFNLQELLLSVEQTFQFRAQEKKLSFVVETAEHMPEMVCGDPTRLVQILNNLINNAIKFTEQGFVYFKVEVDRQESDWVYLRFLIIDSGVGIPEEHLEHIFDRFGQVDSKTTRKFGGTGLGLAISQQLAELQHGKITVQSKVGKGSTFTLQLPYRKVENGANAEKQSENYNDVSPLKAKILIVEDNLLNARILELFLDQWEIEYTCAKNGREALEILQNTAFDLVLMDIQMPVMDGYTAATKIRQELNLDLPIIALTAHAFASERERCLAHGMDDYLAKPIQEDDLRRLILRHLAPDAVPAPFENASQRADRPSGFDPTIITQVSRGNPDKVEEMANVYLEQTQLEIQGLESALEQNDHAQVAKIAHSIKSTVNYMGFERFLNTELQELEQLALQKGVTREALKDKWTPIRAKLDQARTFVQLEFLPKGPIQVSNEKPPSYET